VFISVFSDCWSSREMCRLGELRRRKVITASVYLFHADCEGEGFTVVIDRKTVLTSIAAIYLIMLVFPGVGFVAKAQSDPSFASTDRFAIPALDGTIGFSTGGTYASASLDNNAWKFVNLDLNNSGQPENLTVSAQDSNVVITVYQIFNATVSARLRYTVVGHGVQIFNLGYALKGGDWFVSIDGKFKANNEGYSVSPDQTITVTAATVNASITYFNFGGTPDNANLPFYEQHSVAIVTGVAVAVSLVLIVLLGIRRLKLN
jgi:hypothetical protein